MVDDLAVQRRLALLGEYVELLASLRELPYTEYAARRFEARYLVQACAQVCIDLANHVIAANRWPAARDARDALTRLVEHQVLDPALGGRLQTLVGLRNRLVHLYGDVDDARVHAALGAGLADLDAFARALARLASTGGERSDPAQDSDVTG